MDVVGIKKQEKLSKLELFELENDKLKARIEYLAMEMRLKKIGRIPMQIRRYSLEHKVVLFTVVFEFSS